MIDTTSGTTAAAPLSPPAAEEREVEWALIEHRTADFPPVEVTLPPLPDDASAVMRAVATFYELVYGLRLALGDDRPVLFAVEWVAGKLRFPRTSVHRALRQLVAAGVLSPPVEVPRKGKRAAHAYLPGTGARIDGRTYIAPQLLLGHP